MLRLMVCHWHAATYTGHFRSPVKLQGVYDGISYIRQPSKVRRGRLNFGRTFTLAGQGNQHMYFVVGVEFR